ncbi:MAG TPA: MFS transporter [Gammaproteobacteria bacterium]|nr:MFS transporter [Gammaproteobacteria bacterium]
MAQGSGGMTQGRWSRNALARIVLVGPGELGGLLGGFAYFFCLLCSYYVLRPVRDEMGIRGGVDNLQWLFSATFIAMLAAVPLFSAVAARYPRRRLLPVVYLFFIVCIGGFWLWLGTGHAIDWAARCFFVWLSVFNLFVVSVFWSFLADLFDDEQATRLFGAIAAGGSAGAILGPALTAALAQRLGTASMLPFATGVLALTLPCIAGLERWARRHRGERDGTDSEAALGGSLSDGVRAVARSRYLLGICAFIWLYTSLSTFLYFEQAHMVARTIADSATRTSVFAGIDLATNLLTVGAQLFLTARLVRRLGLGRALALVPILVALGFVVLAAAPALAVIAGVQVLRRAGNYALARPGREMLFTVVSRMEKYKSKNFIDTVVYRGGDALAGWVFAGLSAAGLGLRGIAVAAVPVALVWMLAGYGLGHTREAWARARQREDMPHERATTPDAS